MRKFHPIEWIKDRLFDFGGLCIDAVLSLVTDIPREM